MRILLSQLFTHEIGACWVRQLCGAQSGELSAFTLGQ